MQNLGGCVTAMKPTGASFDKLRIYVLLSSNKYMCLRVSSPNFEIEIPPIPKFMHPCSQNSKVAFFGGDLTSFGSTNNMTTSVHFFDHESHQNVESTATPHIKEIAYLCACGKTIVREIAQWKLNENTLQIIAYSLQHEDPIACISASSAL